MADSGILVIAVIIPDVGKALKPVFPVLFIKVDDVFSNLVILHAPIKKAQGFIKHFMDIISLICQSYGC